MSREHESWLASRLLAAARRVLPRERSPWADAMRAEIFHMPQGAARRWAFGCLMAAIKQRLSPMVTGTFRINRWVMLLEALACFGTLTLAWYLFTFGPAGVTRLNGELIDKVFLASPGGGYLLGLMIGFAVTGLVGPIGLWLGARYALLNRTLSNRALGIALIAAPVLQYIASAVGTIWLGRGDFATGLQMFVLFTALPITGILHLMYLAKPESSTPDDARLAAA